MKNSNMKIPALSVFFPAFNEQENISRQVRYALEVLPKVAKKYEIIVVDDGSTDNTLKISEHLSKQYIQVKTLTQSNRGYGGALKAGFTKAKYSWIFFSDADMQFDLNELQKFIPSTQNNRLVIGYRQQRAEGWKRHLVAQALKIWNRAFLGFPREIKDIDCAFKLIHRDVLSAIQPLHSDGAMISTEILLKAHLNHIPYSQVPVSHFLRKHGTPTGTKFSTIVKAMKETYLLWKTLRQQNYGLCSVFIAQSNS